MSGFDVGSWMAILPEAMLGGAALLVLLLHALGVRPTVLTAVSAGAIFVTAGATVRALGGALPVTFPAATPASSYVALDGYGGFFFVVFLFVALATILSAGPYLEMYGARLGEFYATVLLCTTGMMVMAASQDMLVLYLGLETMSLAAYVLTGFLVDRSKSREAAIKYFLMGAFGSALLLYGVAFLYGATGAITFRGIGAGIGTPEEPVFVLLGIALLLSGFGFKVAAVPFHMWAPDVYHGAPTPVSGLMAVGVKAAAFASLLRVVNVALDDAEGPYLTWILYGLSVLTMAWGNVGAIAQRNIKRLLAYSAVAHAGYLLIAVTVHNDVATPAVLVYLAAYAMMTLGAFAVVMLIEKQGEGDLSLEAYTGLGRKHPYLAVAMTIFLLSLAGIPPTVGFIGKWYIFSSAIAHGYVALAIIGVATSLVSVYYYMRVVYLMFMKDETDATATMGPPNRGARAVAFGLAVLVLLVGCYPKGVVALAQGAGIM